MTQTSATYYEEVGNASRDVFAMKDNPSYVLTSFSINMLIHT